MKKYFRILLLALAGAMLLSACGQSDEDKQKAAAAAAAAAANAPVPLPAATADKASWQKYMVSVVKQNLQTIKNNPYMYFVPAGDSQDEQDARQRQLDNVSDVVARGVLPGNMLAFGGPDSKLTADLIQGAFKNANAGSFKDVVVLFIGAPADQDEVKTAIASSGAEFRFVEMK